MDNNIFFGKPIKTVENTCPYCDYRLDGATGVNHTRSPKKGDVTICISCSQILVYGDKMKLREPTKEENQEFANHPELQLLQKGIRASDRRSINKGKGA